MKVQDMNYMIPKKNRLKTLSIELFSENLPDLKNKDESKVSIISKWLTSKISEGLKSGSMAIDNILPSKSEFAYLLGVSIGTMQNSFRQVEDLGYVESKQCIGTLIRNINKPSASMRKLTSKRDFAADEIKRYILTGGFRTGSLLPSGKTISTIIGFSTNTTRLALDYLQAKGILIRRCNKFNDIDWIVNSLDFNVVTTGNEKSATTLVDMVVKDLENYISENLHIGDRMPVHAELSKILKASIKTIHDALKILADKGIILSRRGQYGTTVIRIPDTSNKTEDLKPENSIFAPAEDAVLYHYERTENYIKKLIAQKYEVGDKLPSIAELAEQLDLSPNTVRKAFHNLANDGYLVFSRGRYGGTFVIDIPEVEQQSFKWLAVNPEFAKEYQGN